MDIFDREKRSDIMSRIRAKNSKAELIAFRYLRSNKIYFQKHYKRIKGSPDIALPRKKRAVFIDGDFWHGRTLERVIERRVSNADYWIPKIRRNIERDIETDEFLEERGWEVLHIWESDLIRKKTRDEVLMKIEKFLTKDTLK